jgi:DNA recombination protein RmuC
LPNETHVFIDAKFPFDAFEQSITATEPDEVLRYRKEHATKLRGHVRTLASKSYWANEAGAPKYTVCFVPSDAALSAAFDADPSLYDFAVQQSVLIAGPTNLMALLWSAHLVLREHERLANVEKILEEASKLPDRISKVATFIAAMGGSLEKAVDNYNQMVASVEGRLIPVALRMQKLGVGVTTKEMPTLDGSTAGPRSLNAAKWDIDPTATYFDRADVLDLEEIEESAIPLEAGIKPSE